MGGARFVLVSRLEDVFGKVNVCYTCRMSLDQPRRPNPNVKMDADTALNRQELAKNIAFFRKMEGERARDKKSFSYTVDRSATELVYDANGYGKLFDAVRARGGSHVLDIGSGLTRGVRELAASPLGHGLHFTATVLKYVDAITKAAEEIPVDVPVKVTPVEKLNGIPDGSQDCIIGTYSIAYTEYPDVAIRACDRVLAPGGFLKMTCNTDPPLRELEQLGYKSAREFAPVLRSMGYAVSVEEYKDTKAVLLAQKPDPNRPILNEQELNDLIARDIADAYNQTCIIRGVEPEKPFDF